MRRLFSSFLFLISSVVNAKEVYIPHAFHEGQPIEQLIFISDVDGVVRDSIEGVADPRVIEAVKSLLEDTNVDVTFISGTPVENDLTVESWRRGNVPLKTVFGASFERELWDNRVTILGTLGGHRMRAGSGFDLLDTYTPEVAFELSTLLLEGFLKEVLDQGSTKQKQLASTLLMDLRHLKFEDCESSENLTASEFRPIITQILEHLDPHFRLVYNGALVETHTSYPRWNTRLSFQWLQKEMDEPHRLVSHLSTSEKRLATGIAKSSQGEFSYLLFSKTNKGSAIQKHLEKKLEQFPHALIVTIGDTVVDFPMHKHAHVAFHVGLEQVWLNNPLPQCVMIRDSEGRDAQHIDGTLKVLRYLKDAMGKSFYDFKYIPKQDAAGRWEYYSLNEIES